MTDTEKIKELELEMHLAKANRDLFRERAEKYNDMFVSLKERIALIKRK